MRLKATVLAFVAGAALAIPATPAQASHHLWRTPGGLWVHFHSRNIVFFDQLSASTNAAADASRTVWDNLTILTLPEASCHSCAHVHQMEGNFGDSGWLGLADPVGWDGTHLTHAHLLYNRYYVETEALKLEVTCHEQGHSLGLDHELTFGAFSCMTGGYGDTTSVAPSTHDVDTVNAMYPATGH